MAETSLKTIIGGTPAGTLTQDEAGLISFRYAEDYQGVPLSLSMPISNRTYKQETLLPYLFGLLPDSERQRRAIALEFGVRPTIQLRCSPISVAIVRAASSFAGRRTLGRRSTGPGPTARSASTISPEGSHPSARTRQSLGWAVMRVGRSVETKVSSRSVFTMALGANASAQQPLPTSSKTASWASGSKRSMSTCA